jgi:hypothetical protein
MSGASGPLADLVERSHPNIGKEFSRESMRIDRG